MALTQQHIDQFKHEGYTAVEGFFDEAEVKLLQQDLERLISIGKLRNVATDGDGKTESNQKVNYQVCPVTPHSDVIRSLQFSDKVKAAITALIGEPALLQLDQIFLKPGRTGKGTSWHQDAAYGGFRIDDFSKGTALWIAIHDAHEANGTIKVIPGQHNEILKHQRDPNSDHHIRCYPDEDQARSIELKAGGVAFFNFGVPHCTGDNSSDHDRAGLAIHFVNRAHAREEVREGNPTAHPQVTGDGASDGGKEFGVSFAGRWEKLLGESKAQA